MPLSILFNAVPAYMAFKTVGRKFTLLSCLCIVLYSTFTDIIPAFPITYDPLLISVFGGIINGMALVMVLNVGASSGGTDFVAMFFSVRKGPIIEALFLFTFSNEPSAITLPPEAPAPGPISMIQSEDESICVS